MSAAFFRSKKFRRGLSEALCFLLALALTLIMMIPFVWMLLCSLQPKSAAIFANPPVLPRPFAFRNYADVFRELDMLRLFGNTMILVVANMVIGIGAAISVAYAFARFQVRGKNFYFSVLLATMMLPWIVTLVPQYIIYNKIGLLGTRWPLILPSIGGGAFFIFLFRQFLMGIPKDLDEAAMIDGCNRLGILVRILIPQCTPILVTMVIFSFNGQWSDYVGPSIYLSQKSMHTLSVGLASYVTADSATPWHKVMAGCVLFSIPMIAVMFAAQNAFTRGIVTSGLKG